MTLISKTNPVYHSFEPTGEVRTPNKGDHFIHSDGSGIVMKTDTNGVSCVPVLGTQRVIVARQGYYVLKITHDQMQHLARHSDIRVRNIGATAVWSKS